MIVVFPFSFGGKDTDNHKELGELFVRVTKKRHPNYRVVQLTDNETSEVRGVDGCFRVPTPHFDGDASRHKAAPGTAFGEWYFDAMSSFPAEHFLRVDYDVLIREDVSDVFLAPFDIAIAKENKGRMNNGVVFVKNREFFLNAKQHYANTGRDNWQDVQTAMQTAIDEGLFRVKKLDSSYNTIFDPDRMRNGAPSVPVAAKIMHFKGWRKGAILDLFQ